MAVELSTLGDIIKVAYEGEADTNAFTDAEKIKLAGLENGATGDQTGVEIIALINSELGSTDWQEFGNVTKVGTPVDDQIGVWTGDGTLEGTPNLRYDGTALTIVGNIVVSGTVDGRDILADGLKLDGIDANATDDQTGAEIVAAITSELGSPDWQDVNTGPVGSQGAIGFTGSSGAGFVGSQGIPGNDGLDGFAGSQGSLGFSGSRGFTGSQGNQGISGFTGSAGFAEATVQATIPAAPEQGALWFDTTDTTLYIYYDDGTSAQWVGVTGPKGAPGFTGSSGGFVGSSGAGGANVTVQATAPTSPTTGDLWYNTTNDTLNVYDGTTWNNVSGTTGFTGSTGGGSILTAAASPPPSATPGDFWFNTNDASLSVYYDDGNSEQWVGVGGPQGEAGFVGSAGEAIAAVQATAPSGPVPGQIWLDTTDSTFYVYYDDGSSAQWLGVSGPTGATGFVGSQGIAGFTGSAGTGFTGSKGGSIDAQNTPPLAPSSGDLWFNTNDSSLYIYYDDGNSTQWVSVGGPQGPTGFTGSSVSSFNLNFVSGSVQNLDIGSYTFFDAGLIDQNVEIQFSNVPTEAKWTWSGNIAEFNGSGLSSAAYTGSPFALGAQDTAPSGIAFGNNGTVMYVSGKTLDRIYQYNLSSSYNISTASYSGTSFAVGAQDTNPQAIRVGASGTVMYMLGGNTNRIFQYSISTQWDLSSAVYSGVSYDCSGEDNSCQGLDISTDGTKILVSGNQNSRIYQYTLVNPFNLSSATYDNVSFDTSDQDIEPSDISFNQDGSRLFVMGTDTNHVYQYALGSEFDISTMFYSFVSFDFSSQVSAASGFVMRDDLTNMYIVDDSSDSVYQYNLIEAQYPSITLPDSVQNANVIKFESADYLPNNHWLTLDFVTYDGGNTVHVIRNNRTKPSGTGSSLTASASSVSIQSFPPAGPDTGDLWFDDTDLTLSIYFDDGNSFQWVGVSGPAGVSGDDGFVGSQGTIGFTGSAGAGFTGSQGVAGFVGSRGPSGPTQTMTQDTAPAMPSNGDVWFDTDSLTLLVYYDDGSSAQWVAVSGPIGPTGPSGFVGSQGAIGFTGSGLKTFDPDLLSGSTQNMNVGLNDFFDGGVMDGFILLTFSNMPTEANWKWTAQLGAGAFSPSGEISFPANVTNREVPYLISNQTGAAIGKQITIEFYTKDAGTTIRILSINIY